LFHQLQRGRGGDRFGHGGDAEDAVHPHRRSGGIPPAECTLVERLVRAGGHAHDRRDVSPADARPERLVDVSAAGCCQESIEAQRRGNAASQKRSAVVGAHIGTIVAQDGVAAECAVLT